MAEPFLQSESFPESEPFFSRIQSTESYHQPEPIVHPVETFHNPSPEFFGELSPRSRDTVVSSVNPIISPQRSRPGPQPAFRSDPLESFPSFSGPSFDTFLLEEARDGPGAEFSQPTFSSFSSPPSSVGQQRGREGSARFLDLPEARSEDESSFGAESAHLGSFRTFGGRWFADSPLFFGQSSAWFHGA